MSRTNGSQNTKNGNGSEPGSKRLSYQQLKERVLELSRGESCLIEEPLDTGLWPSAGLSDTQMRLLIAALSKQPAPKI